MGDNAEKNQHNGDVITMSWELIGLIVGFLTLMATAIGVPAAAFFSLRSDLQTGQKSLREEIETLRTDTQTGQESLREDIGTLRTDTQTGQESLREDIGTLRTDTQTGQESLREDMRAGYESLRTEIRDSNAEVKAELRALNKRVDGTNARIDSLAEAFYLTSPEKTGA